jgi:hypothetical protein
VNTLEPGAPEEAFDAAIQRLLDGPAAVPGDPAAPPELGALLAVARAIQQAPPPELPAARLAALVANAQAQAITGSTAAQQATQLLEPGRPVPASGLPGHVPGRAHWLRFFTTPWGLAAGLAMLIIGLTSGWALANLVFRATPQPFVHDGRVQQIGSTAWVVGGLPIAVDAQTVIQGVPLIGAPAHVEGDQWPDRRLARRIVVGPLPGPLPTVTPLGVGTASPSPSATASPSATPSPLSQPTEQPPIVGTPFPPPTVTLLPVVPTATSAPAPPTPVPPPVAGSTVTICHRTGSAKNPYVVLTVGGSALAAHRGHGDLIPMPAGGCPAVAPPGSGSGGSEQDKNKGKDKKKDK